MHNILNFRRGAFLLAASALLFTSCHQEPNNVLADGDDNGGYASDASRIEFVNNDVISMADIAGTQYNGIFIGSGVQVGTDTVSTPHMLTIYFGEKGIVCSDGRTRKGTIMIKYNGRYTDTSQLHQITYDRYSLNGNRLTGFVQTTRVDTTVTGNWYYNVSVNDSLNIDPDPLKSKVIAWSGNLVRKWVSGIETGARGDDAFSISGAATLVRANGHQFSFGISTPLQFATACDYAESGIINVTGYTGNRVLNYGDGNCDNKAQVNIGVHVYPVTLTK